jgi:hypothetical protein
MFLSVCSAKSAKKENMYTKMKFRFIDVLAYFQLKTVLLLKYGFVFVFGKL